jgi:yeast amino acid transporter
MTSIFSAGNTYTYVATRTLHGLAIEGRAPKFLNYTNRSGVPVYCFCVVMLFPLLSFLQVSSGSAVVLNWFISLITGGGLINFLVMSITFLHYYKATKVQNFDRKKLPYYGWFQPYGAYIALAVQTFVLFGYGYTSFKPFDVSSFFQSYAMQIISPCLFIGWKIFKKTKVVPTKDVDLVWERPSIDLYENTTHEPITGFWEEMGHLVGIKKNVKNASHA